MPEIRAPFSAAEVQSPAHAAPLAVTITNPGLTIINVANNAAAVTINVTNSITPIDGTTIIFRIPTTAGARIITPGTNLGGVATVSLTTTKNFVWQFVWMTDKYYPMSATAVQID